MYISCYCDQMLELRQWLLNNSDLSNCNFWFTYIIWKVRDIRGKFKTFLRYLAVKLTFCRVKDKVLAPGSPHIITVKEVLFAVHTYLHHMKFLYLSVHKRYLSQKLPDHMHIAVPHWVPTFKMGSPPPLWDQSISFLSQTLRAKVCNYIWGKVVLP